MRREVRISDELDTRVVHQRPLREPQRRHLWALELDGRRTSEATCYRDDRRHIGGEQALEESYALINRDRVDPRSREGLRDAQLFCHADASPDRPFGRK